MKPKFQLVLQIIDVIPFIRKEFKKLVLWLSGLNNDPVPAQSGIGFIAWRAVEGDQFAAVGIGAADATFRSQTHIIRQYALAVRGGYYPAGGIDQQRARRLVLGVAEAHSFGDRPGLRLPIEMDAEYAQQPALGVAVFAHASGVSGDLSVLEQGL